MKEILYFCFNYPFPPKIGEEQNFASHIKDLAGSKFNNLLMLLFSNPNENNGKMPYNIDYKIFEAKKNLFFKKFIYFIHILFSKYPKNISNTKSLKIGKYITTQEPKIFILDAIYSIAMLPKYKKQKLIYIAHNNEAKLYHDLAKIEKNLFMKIYRYLYLYRISKLEKELLEKSDKIVCISTSDYNYFKGIYPNKVEFLPHRIELQKNSWEGKGEKSLFFCGPLNFAPNYDSVKWIAEELSPVLAKDIKIKIAGKGTDNVPEEWKKDNIEYLGFVSREELLDLYRNCSAFICPIVYGSGVKIKVTEALGFGTPVIATKEALEGLDYIDIKPLIDRSDLQKTKENIEMLLNNQSKLQEYSSNLISQIETYQRKNDNSLEKIIGECIDE